MIVSCAILLLSLIFLSGMLFAKSHLYRSIFQFFSLTLVSVIFSILGFTLLSLVVFISNLFLFILFYVFSSMFFNIKSLKHNNIAKALGCCMVVLIMGASSYLLKDKVGVNYWVLPAEGRSFSISSVIFNDHFVSVGLLLVAMMSLILLVLFLISKRENR